MEAPAKRPWAGARLAGMVRGAARALARAREASLASDLAAEGEAALRIGDEGLGCVALGRVAAKMLKGGMQERWPILAEACAARSPWRLEALLRAGLDPNACDGAAMRAAALAGEPRLVELLIEAGAEPWGRRDGALWNAVRGRSVEVARLVGPLAARGFGGAPIDSGPDSGALSLAAWEGDERMVAQMARWIRPDAEGSLALRYAMQRGHWGAADLLAPDSERGLAREALAQGQAAGFKMERAAAFFASVELGELLAATPEAGEPPARRKGPRL